MKAQQSQAKGSLTGGSATASAFALPRWAFGARLALLIPVMVALYPSVGTRPLALAAIGLLFVSTLLAGFFARRGSLPLNGARSICLLDFGALLAAHGAAPGSLPFLLPAATVLSAATTLLQGRAGAWAAAVIPAGAFGAAAALNPAAPDAWMPLSLWALQNLVTTAVLGGYAAHQNRLREKQESVNATLRGEAERQAEMAVRDPLTGLYNRRSLNQRLHEEMARAQRSRAPLSLAMIDVDYLKQWNDNYGHAAGDAALQALAKALITECRAGDTVYRIGGEEFVLLAPDTDVEGLRALIERIQNTVRVLSIAADGKPVPRRLTFSAGVVQCDLLQDDTAFLEAADTAAYSAKNAGRDRVEIGSYPPPDESELLWKAGVLTPIDNR